MSDPAAETDLAAGSEAGMIFPLGQPVGLTSALEWSALNDMTDFDASDELCYVVRGGRRSHALNSAQYRVWRLAHELDPLVGQPWTGPAINGQLFAHGVLHGLETVNRLIEANLMTEVETSDAAIVSFASSVRVRPLFVGLGNSPEQPGMFHIGSGSTVVAAVTPLVYLLFSLAPQGLDLYQTVVKMHLMAGEGGLSDSITADPVVMLRALLPALLELLAADAIYLEARSDEIA